MIDRLKSAPPGPEKTLKKYRLNNARVSLVKMSPGSAPARACCDELRQRQLVRVDLLGGGLFRQICQRRFELAMERAVFLEPFFERRHHLRVGVDRRLLGGISGRHCTGRRPGPRRRGGENRRGECERYW